MANVEKHPCANRQFFTLQIQKWATRAQHSPNRWGFSIRKMNFDIVTQQVIAMTRVPTWQRLASSPEAKPSAKLGKGALNPQF